MPADIDPRSERIALFYTGDDSGHPAISGVPARDLTEGDVARIVYVEHHRGADGERQTLTGAAFTTAADAVLDRLTAGPYQRTAPEKKTAKKSAPADATPQPADSGTPED